MKDNDHGDDDSSDEGRLDALPPPPAVLDDPDAFEVLRVWGSRNEQLVSMLPIAQGQPERWGLFLAELARALAEAHQSQDGIPAEEALARIWHALETEWARTNANGDLEAVN